MSLQDPSLEQCFDDLAQIDADLRALAADAALTPPPPRITALMQACFQRLRQQREALLVRLQMGLGAQKGGMLLVGFPCRRAYRGRAARR